MAARGSPATTSFPFCNTTNEYNPRGRGCALWPRSISTCGCWAGGPTGSTNCGRSFRPSRWRTRIDIAFTPGRKTSIELQDALGIPDNLVARAARLVMEASRAAGRVEMRPPETHPNGCGIGRRVFRRSGGAAGAAGTDGARAAACQAGANWAQQLGSDVPFFLLGGRAVGIGRGTELFPLPDAAPRRGLLLAPEVHVNTAQAYRDLSPRLTTESSQNKIFSFQSHTWELSGCAPAENDFEAVVFEQHRRLAVLKRRLIQAGASPAMMTGSGSALFGLFRNSAEVSRAIQLIGQSAADVQSFPITLVGRARYRSQWWRTLNEHTNRRLWPPLSRYDR